MPNIKQGFSFSHLAMKATDKMAHETFSQPTNLNHLKSKYCKCTRVRKKATMFNLQNALLDCVVLFHMLKDCVATPGML